ncbi:hypothetical protein SO802_023001 [Lithocarpus litseifolius]|uniref:Uncharacterized protein n=1 Tax=Lithocarpus litseifolius TaxID=425828 RepID=A0AAW2C6H3_9ROSI
MWGSGRQSFKVTRWWYVMLYKDWSLRPLQWSTYSRDFWTELHALGSGRCLTSNDREMSCSFTGQLAQHVEDYVAWLEECPEHACAEVKL